MRIRRWRMERRHRVFIRAGHNKAQAVRIHTLLGRFYRKILPVVRGRRVRILGLRRLEVSSGRFRH